MPLINLNLNTGVASTSATKAQVALAKELFGAKGEAIVKRLEDLHKIKELNTDTKVLPVLDLLKTDSAQVAAFKKTAGGKSTITGVRALVQAKTLVQIVNALRQIKAPRASKTGLKGTASPTARTKTPVRDNPDVPDIAQLKPQFFNTPTQESMEALAANISSALGMKFRAELDTNNNFQGSAWSFVYKHGKGTVKSIRLEPPFTHHDISSSKTWSIMLTLSNGDLIGGKEMRKITYPLLKAEVQRLIKTAPKKVDKKTTILWRNAVAINFMSDGSIILRGNNINQRHCVRYMIDSDLPIDPASSNLLMGKGDKVLTKAQKEKIRQFVGSDPAFKIVPQTAKHTWDALQKATLGPMSLSGNTPTYKRLLGAVMGDGDGDDTDGLFRTIGLTAPSNVGAALMDFGTDDEGIIIYTNRAPYKGILLAKTSDLKSSFLQKYRGAGVYTVYTYTGDELDEVPLNKVHQLGDFKTWPDAYNAFINAVRAF